MARDQSLTIPDERVAQFPASRRRFERPSTSSLDDHVAQLRALRERLANDLAEMENRVEQLARLNVEQPPAPAPEVDAERIAEVQEKLRRVSELLARSHQMRLAISDQLVLRAHEQGLEEAEHEARRSRTRLVAGLAALAGLILAIGGGALAAIALTDSPTVSDPAPPQVRTRVVEKAVPPCSAVAEGSGPVSCSTGTRLTIAGGETPIAVGGTEARVLRTVRTPTVAVVRLRLRNTSSSPQNYAGRVYLATGDRRLPAQYSGSSQRLAPGEAKTVVARFLTDFEAAAALDAAGGKAEIGVIPFSEKVSSKPERLGVLRVAF